MTPTNKKIIAGGVALAIAATSTGYWIGSARDGATAEAENGGVIDGVTQDGSGKVVKYWFDAMIPMAVSYTHLTLPTKRIV